MLEVAHALGQGLHFAQTFMYLFQPVGHLLEALAQTGLQRGLQFFVHRGAHFVQLGGIGALQLHELRFQRGTHFGQHAGAGFAQLGDAARIGFT